MRPAVFLDRDGVIVEDPGYLSNVDDIRYVAGSLEAIRKLNDAGWLVIVATNQSGIGRGFYGWTEFEAVQSAIETELAGVGGWLDGIWACPFFPEHPFRKPNPGMLNEAVGTLSVDVTRSVMVGDRVSDLVAGLRAGIKGAFLVETGHGSAALAEAKKMALRGDNVATCANLRSAVELIITENIW